MWLEFDKNGYLKPKGKMNLTLEVFTHNFVEAFQDRETTRTLLFENFQNFQAELGSLLRYPYSIWLDGSFVSQKINPTDLDAVYLLDYRDCEAHRSVFDQKYFSSAQKQVKRLDFYYSLEYPLNHKRHFLSHLNHLYWEDIYGYSRPDENGYRTPKGFVEIKIG